jgi:hypothetical protein
MSPAKRRLTADELMTQLESDPQYIERQRRLQATQEARQRAYQDAASGLFRDLQSAGYKVTTLDELRRRGDMLAVPILAGWMKRIGYLPLKQDVIRTLGSKWARPVASRALIDEFHRYMPETDPTGSDIRFTIGDSLERVADDDVADDLIAIAEDQTHGSQRGLIVAALGNLKQHRARVLPILVSLLNDPTVALYAIMGLGKLKDRSARTHIERFADHPDESVRREAKKTLAKLK